MLWVFGILLVTAIGTTAPFSAMSGAVMMMSLLSAGLAAPRLLSASATALDSKPVLFQVAASAYRAVGRRPRSLEKRGPDHKRERACRTRQLEKSSAQWVHQSSFAL